MARRERHQLLVPGTRNVLWEFREVKAVEPRNVLESGGREVVDAAARVAKEVHARVEQDAFEAVCEGRDRWAWERWFEDGEKEGAGVDKVGVGSEGGWSPERDVWSVGVRWEFAVGWWRGRKEGLGASLSVFRSSRGGLRRKCG